MDNDFNEDQKEVFVEGEKEDPAEKEYTDQDNEGCCSEELRIIKQDLEKSREEAKKNHDQYLRALAEVENIRKRAMRERDEYTKFASVPLIRKLLSISDDMERALHMSQANQDFNALSKGVEMISKKLQEIIQTEGIKEIQALGSSFDPQLHEPLSVEKREDCPANMVVEELQKGYTLYGRVIRPSLVKVSN